MEDTYKSSISTAKLLKLVKEEADNIKHYATPEEISKLNFDTLDPEWHSNCIYGQMTGSCYSSRANELIIKCAKKVYEPNEDGTDPLVKVKLNGSPYLIDKPTNRGDLYHSPIEIFIIATTKAVGKNSNNERLIKYIKGEIKTPNLRLPENLIYKY